MHSDDGFDNGGAIEKEILEWKGRLKMKKSLISDKTVSILSVALSAIISLAMIVGAKVMLNYDSYSYINAIDKISNFQIDALRTPVYPFLLFISKIIFGKGVYLWAVIILQHIIFVLSVYYLVKIIRQITTNSIFILITVFVYNLGINLLGWNNMIMSESLATSGMTILLAVTFNFLKEKKISDIIRISALILILIFHRPIFIYLLPVYLSVMIVLLCKKQRRIAIKGFFSLLIVIFSILSYMFVFKQTFGVFAMSNVNIFNNIFIARQAQLLTPESVDDPSFAEALAKHYEDHGQVVADTRKISYFCEGLVSAHPLPILQDNINKVISENKIEWIKLIWNRFITSFHETLFPLGQSAFGFLPLSILYLLILIYTLTFTLAKSKKDIVPFLWLILLLEIANIATAIVGAQDACNRLVIPSIAIPSIMVAYVLNTIGQCIKNQDVL